jgi:hypothetical protein
VVAERMFTVAEARAMLPEILERAERLVAVRADLVTSTANHNAGIPTSVAEIKAFEANMGELIDGFRAWGLKVAGYAPLLLDFRTEIDGAPAWLCWLENEDDIAWWHGDEVGFMGRRRLPDRMPEE